MILDVVQYPHAILKTPSEPVRPLDLYVQKLARDMMATMLHHPRCVGLAASQVGHALRILTIDARRIEKPGSYQGRLALANPKVLSMRGQRLIREGCLSVPDYTGNVLRAESLTLEAWTLEGKKLEIHADGFEAIVFQHELDHLEGKLFLDRVASVETDVFRRKRYG